MSSLANREPAPAAGPAVTAGGSRGIIRALAFILEADGAAAMAERAAAALAVLPAVQWAELDSRRAPGADTLTIELCERGPCLTVALADAADEGTTAELCELLGVVAAVTRREQRVEALDAQARTDALTGLWNRRAFDELLDQALSRAGRSDESVATLAIDIDRFKRINDELGHEAGDRALATVAAAIRSVTRPSDVAARLGGDEIAILLAGCDAEGARTVAARLQDTVAETAPHAEPPLTLSIGIADVAMLAKPGPGVANRTTLLRLADEALYLAKHAGRNTVVCHPGQAVAILHAA